MIAVPDASVIIELVLVIAPGARICRRLSDPRVSMHGLQPVDLEVPDMLRRYVNTKLVTMDRAAQAVGIPEGSDLRRHRNRAMFHRARSWRSNLMAYDAAYVAPAEFPDGPLLTTDARPANASNLPVPVEVFAADGETFVRPGLRSPPSRT